MAVKRINRNLAYGLDNALQQLAPQPIVAHRDPTTSDIAQIGTIWVNPLDQTSWILVSIAANSANWAQSGGNGPGDFTTVTVTGGSGNALTVNQGNVVVGNGSLSVTGGTLTVTNGMTIAANGLITMDPVTTTSATAAATLNANVGQIGFTGFTTAAAASQAFTITNSLVTTASMILVTVANLGSNDAQMTLTRVNPGTGSFVVTATNNGAAALNGTVLVNFWVVAS